MRSDFPPLAIRIWMHKLKKGVALPAATLEKCLLNKMSSDAASLSVANACERGILVPRTEGTRSKRVSLAFCQKLSSLTIPANDPYCYECHLPGDLKECPACIRTFHESCRRKDPEKPNYCVPSDKGQPYRLPQNESDEEDENPTEDFPQTPTPEPLLDHNSNINEGHVTSDTPAFLKHESLEWDDDVFFVSERKGSRQRKQANVKDEHQTNLDSDTSSELEYCTRCRLLKMASLHNPPQLDKQELASLLKYSWGTHHSWLDRDVSKYMAKNWNDRDRALVKRILFKTKILGVADIERNIASKKYIYLTEFLVDLLDLQHNIAVFYGPKSVEYTATKWLLRDVTHDIREIRKCPDCFRYSNEANLSSLWFAKPCLQRHELVFAKQAGSPPWPAKVISVSRRKPIKYDVRFFGGSHSRALISERDIIPIESDIQSHFKPKNSKALNAALRELQCHMILSHYSASQFGFYADPKIAENLIQVALSHCNESSETPQSTKKRKLNSTSSNSPVPKRILPVRRCSIAFRSEALQETGSSYADSVIYQNLASEIIQANEELVKCQGELAVMRQKLEAVKRKRWCYLCLKEAAFDCCFTASYCSGECQRRDKRRHQATCKVNQ
ncbi:zinc finger MYND domain-containing protein 11 [Drosophila bipectinata]|uniref:zinc finger MYND domain-containing protein 11 n=1 Tax=Drosophila bipectinata TaxID=42026 RepID=UPI001C8AEC4B|nr:zinc finger MYND domain-containing protein 11 [Drosophila bipectinata]